MQPFPHRERYIQRVDYTNEFANDAIGAMALLRGQCTQNATDACREKYDLADDHPVAAMIDRELIENVEPFEPDHKYVAKRLTCWIRLEWWDDRGPGDMLLGFPVKIVPESDAAPPAPG